MGDLKNELKKYHINYDGEVNEEKFIDTLHNKIHENKNKPKKAPKWNSLNAMNGVINATVTAKIAAKRNFLIK